jgi:hypothetical protein
MVGHEAILNYGQSHINNANAGSELCGEGCFKRLTLGHGVSVEGEAECCAKSDTKERMGEECKTNMPVVACGKHEGSQIEGIGQTGEEGREITAWDNDNLLGFSINLINKKPL